MSTLLRIDSSIRVEGSESRLLADQYQARWATANQPANVVLRDLTTTPIHQLEAQTVDGFADTDMRSGGLTLSDQLIAELHEAEHLLIASPQYNLSVASGLKAYFDYVVRAGKTFEMVEGQYRGLLGGKSATLIATSGGPANTDAGSDMHVGYLRSILAFVGIDDVDVISLNGTAFPPEEVQRRRNEALAEIDARFGFVSEPEWSGPVSDQDRVEISNLRSQQAAAIVAGDAAKYGDLCVRDIQLAIPGGHLVTGLDRFIAAEEALFEQASFRRFLKKPVSVHVSGDLAVEVGYQDVDAAGANIGGGAFSSRQKYVHVMERTTDGWRYKVLSSNPTE